MQNDPLSGREPRHGHRAADGKSEPGKPGAPRPGANGARRRPGAKKLTGHAAGAADNAEAATPASAPDKLQNERQDTRRGRKRKRRGGRSEGRNRAVPAGPGPGLSPGSPSSDAKPQNAAGQGPLGHRRSEVCDASADGDTLSNGTLSNGTGLNGRPDGAVSRSGSDPLRQPAERAGVAPYMRHRVSTPDRPLYAALDLGTNNCRLLIARPEERGFRVVDAYSRIVRLGEGVGANRRLSDAAMDRAVEALANCQRKLVDRGVERSRLIATEACRAAENGTEFIDRVRNETGLDLEVVNRETEARLAVAGCVSLVDRDADGVILFDIGGGSSEIVWLDLRNRCGARGYALTRFIRSWASLPVGVVNLAERHGGVHVTPDVFEAMVDDVSAHLQDFSLGNDLSAAISGGAVHMLGTSGTVTTLAGVHFGLKRYDRRRVDGAWLDDTQVGSMIDRLRDMPYEERVENPCIGADRADLVLAGCAILEAIRRRWTCSRLRVADRGLREGILTELMSADGVWSRRRKHTGRERGRYRGKP
nr:Ppx/GppA phosphatase family protein [Roseibium hamelinense]